jgi:hypothetical protein
MPQENIGFSQLFKANATSPQLPEIYTYRTAILQRALIFRAYVCARLGEERRETGGSIFPT